MYNEKIMQELEAKKRHNRIMKKRILVSFVTALVITAMLGGIAALMHFGWLTEMTEPGPEWYEFAPITDFNYNIMEDDWYKNQLGIGPIVRFHNAQTGVGIELPEDQYGEHGKAVKLLTDLVIAAQKGDNDAYNNCFSDAYLIAEGKKKAEADGVTYTDAEYLALGKKSEFTMQQIYDVVITLYSEEKTADKLLTCTYELKYKIHLNNGTLRNDMGSDCYRVQRIVMLENKDTGELEITSVANFSSDSAKEDPIIWRIVLVASAFLVLSVGVIIASVRYVKKSEAKEKAGDITDDIPENEETDS